MAGKKNISINNWTKSLVSPYQEKWAAIDYEK
jgi:hypothetical protein